LRDKILIALIKNLHCTVPQFDDVDSAQEFIDDKNTITNNAIIVQQKAIAKYVVELADDINERLKGN
jgi:hypothetical protein